MPDASTVLVADSSDARRRELGLSLYQGGYEVIKAINGEEAMRFTAGLDPTLVIVHTGLAGLEPLEIHSCLTAAGLEVPPMLILCEEIPELGDDHPDGAFYYLPSADLEPVRFRHQVGLLLLAREIGGELSDTIDSLDGDLARISIEDLLRVLSRYMLTGHVSFLEGPRAGIWVADGVVVDAHWADTSGRKAFNRVAGLRGGSFVLDLESATVEQTIDVDCASLVSGALEEKLQLEEVLGRLPSLGCRVELCMGEDFFAGDFSVSERELLAQVQQAKNLGDLIDRVPVTDFEALQIVERLQGRGFLALHEPRHRLRRAAGGVGEPAIRVVDSRSDSVALGMLVVFASRMAQRGLSADEIVACLEAMRSRLHLLFLVDTLEGGRPGGARAMLGTLLGIKPIFGVIDGEVTPVGRVRSGGEALARLVELFKARLDPERPVLAGLAHASAPRSAERLKEILCKEIQIAELFECEIDAVVDAHAGPGTVGVVVFQPTEEEMELVKGE